MDTHTRLGVAFIATILTSGMALMAWQAKAYNYAFLQHMEKWT